MGNLGYYIKRFNPTQQVAELHLEPMCGFPQRTVMVCVDPTTKDDLHLVEVDGKGLDGGRVRAVLATLKPSTTPSVSVGDFVVKPPVRFTLKYGPGPIHISGQHIFKPGPNYEEMGEEEEAVNLLNPLSPSNEMEMKKEDDYVDIEEIDDLDDIYQPTVPVAYKDNI